MIDNFAIQLFEGKQVRIVWDAGRYQIFHSMKDAEIGQEEWLALDKEHKKLGEKIWSQLYTLGFLR